MEANLKNCKGCKKPLKVVSLKNGAQVYCVSPQNLCELSLKVFFINKEK